MAQELHRATLERPRVRQRLSPSHVPSGSIPPMLHDSMQDRQSDIQEAITSGSVKRFVELALMQSNVAKRLAELPGGVGP